MSSICDFLVTGYEYTCKLTREPVEGHLLDTYCGCRSTCNYWDCPIYKKYYES